MDCEELLKALDNLITNADGEFPEFPNSQYKPSAVLIPVVQREDGLYILLTKRNENLKNHPGQVCFPGGKVDSTDESPAATAIRECFEELGIKDNKIKIWGMLEPMKVPTGYFLIPVIGELQSDYTLNLHLDEVETAFEVPFAHFMDIENYLARRIFYRGRNHRFFEIKHHQHYIWGATAKILRKISKIV